MHIGYLVIAVRDVLRAAFLPEKNPLLFFPEKAIDVMPSGQPPPDCGERFIAVHGSSWNPANDDANVALDAYMGVNVTLSCRTSWVPRGELGTRAYADTQLGMAQICYRIMTAVTMQAGSATDVPLFTALENLDGYVSGSIFEYLRWQGTDPAPLEQFSDWFTARNEHLEDPAGMAIMGHSMTVRFGKARAGVVFS